jgi:hypothetical protein
MPSRTSASACALAFRYRSVSAPLCRSSKGKGKSKRIHPISAPRRRLRSASGSALNPHHRVHCGTSRPHDMVGRGTDKGASPGSPPGAQRGRERALRSPARDVRPPRRRYPVPGWPVPCPCRYRGAVVETERHDGRRQAILSEKKTRLSVLVDQRSKANCDTRHLSPADMKHGQEMEDREEQIGELAKKAGGAPRGTCRSASAAPTDSVSRGSVVSAILDVGRCHRHRQGIDRQRSCHG